tara:strand:- start:922 stop:3303 length:2382 start_codon:yes stop_codon:yes gene_type:complete
MAEETIEDLKARIALQETEIGLLREKTEFLGDEEALASSQLELAKKRLEAQRELVIEQGNLKDLTEDQRAALVESIKQQQNQVKLAEANVKAIKKSQAATEQLSQVTASYFSQLTLINEGWRETFLGGMAQAIASTKGLEGSFKKLAESIKNLPLNLVANVMGQIEQSTVQVIQNLLAGNAELVRATGLIDQNFTQQIESLGKQFGNMALGVEESRVALFSLYTGFSNFRNLTDSTQQSLKETTMTMIGLGVDGRTAVKFMDDAMKSFGMSAEEAQQTAKDLYTISRDLTITAEEMMDQFSRFSGYLSAFKNGKEIFKELAVFADKSGIALDSLVGIAQQFDTFDGAARSVGKLNTALGQNFFDFQKMLRLRPGERIEEIRKQLLLAAPDFENMNEYQLRFIAGSAGFKDVGEFMKFMRAETVETEDKFKKFGLTQKDVEEIATKSKTPMQAMTAAFQQLAIEVAPAVNQLVDFVTTIVKFLSESGGVIKDIIIYGLAFGAMAKAVSLIVAPLKLVKDMFKAFKPAGTAAQAGANEVLAASYTKLGVASTAAAGPVTAMTVPLALTALSVAAVIIVLADLIKYAIDAKVPMMELGVGFLFIAAGVAGLTLAFALAASMAPVAKIGFLVMAAALVALGAALLTVKTADLRAIADIFQGMAKTAGKNPFENWISGIGEFADKATDVQSSLATIGKAFEKLDIDAEKAKPTIQLVTAMSKIDSESVAGLTQAHKLVKELQVAINVNTADAVNRLIDVVAGASKTSSEKSQTVTVEIDGKILGKFVGKAVKEGIKGR